MESEQVAVNINVNGNVLTFRLPAEQEPIYREASELISGRLKELYNTHGDKANSEQILSILSVESIVDAIQAHRHYSSLQTQVDQKIGQLNEILLP